ncbi:MAG: hypothetical protein HKN23_03460 [Verrucomicrobiales bacterium]|nr:hypothetical protein [Verrucomicrobiales bacterium]
MSAAKSLTKEQIAEIQSWADDGASLPDIQQRLREEMDVSVTYMEMRFLIEDIGVTLPPDPVKEPEAEETEEGDDEAVDESPDPDPQDLETDEPAASDDESSDEGPTEEANVTVDELQRPGMVVSGKVTFSGGKSLGWYLDQMGRLGMEPGPDEEFRPSEDQLLAFQAELQKVLAKKGF